MAITVGIDVLGDPNNAREWDAREVVPYKRERAWRTPAKRVRGLLLSLPPRTAKRSSLSLPLGEGGTSKASDG